MLEPDAVQGAFARNFHLEIHEPTGTENMGEQVGDVRASTHHYQLRIPTGHFLITDSFVLHNWMPILAPDLQEHCK